MTVIKKNVEISTKQHNISKKRDEIKQKLKEQRDAQIVKNTQEGKLSQVNSALVLMLDQVANLK